MSQFVVTLLAWIAFDKSPARSEVIHTLNTDSAVLVGCDDRAIYARVCGRGTFQNSAGLKTFCRSMIEKGYRRFVVDLLDCEVMDSTFMGTLAGIGLQLKRVPDGDLEVVRANERNATLLENLGLDQVFSVRAIGDPRAPEFPREVNFGTVPESPNTRCDARQDVLEAHEALVEADQENAVRFRNVLEVLAKEKEGTSQP